MDDPSRPSVAQLDHAVHRADKETRRVEYQGTYQDFHVAAERRRRRHWARATVKGKGPVLEVSKEELARAEDVGRYRNWSPPQ